MLLNLFLLVIGFIVLIKGADFFVDGASSFASNLKVPKMVIALSILAFGTSAPEFAVSFKSMLEGSGELVLGNVIGSNIINILLILGVSSLICPLTVKSDTIKKEIPILFMITLLLSVLFCDNILGSDEINIITRSDGIVILLFFSIFIYYLFSVIRKRKEEEETSKYPLGKSIIISILGIIAIILGSHFVVEGATFIAKCFGVSERIIGLTIVALGTSLPELMTSIVAAKKGEVDLAVGNILGSNIFNIGIVLALPVVIFGDIVPIGFSLVDIIVMIISTVVLFWFSANDQRISAKEGFIMLAIFLLYYGYMIIEGVF